MIQLKTIMPQLEAFGRQPTTPPQFLRGDIVKLKPKFLPRFPKYKKEDVFVVLANRGDVTGLYSIQQINNSQKYQYNQVFKVTDEMIAKTKYQGETRL